MFARYSLSPYDEEIGTEDFRFVESFMKATGRTQIGWYYITDITWIYSRVKDWSRDLKIVDAGGEGTTAVPLS